MTKENAAANKSRIGDRGVILASTRWDTGSRDVEFLQGGSISRLADPRQRRMTINAPSGKTVHSATKSADCYPKAIRTRFENMIGGAMPRDYVLIGPEVVSKR